MQLLPSPICYTFSSFWLLFGFNTYLKNIRFLVYPCVVDIIAMAGNRTISYFQRMYDSSPVEGISQELNLEY